MITLGGQNMKLLESREKVRIVTSIDEVWGNFVSADGYWFQLFF